MWIIGLPGWIDHVLTAAAVLPGETTYDTMLYPLATDRLRLRPRADQMAYPLTQDEITHPIAQDTAHTPIIRGI